MGPYFRYPVEAVVDELVDAVVLLAQAPRLKAIAASAIIAMYFMISSFPLLSCQLA